MTGPHLVIYSYIYFLFFYSIYLFIHFLVTFFFTKGVYQKELFYLTYLGSVLINLYLAFIWMRFGILLYREVRKKWFPSERKVSEEHGTQQFNIGHGRGDQFWLAVRQFLPLRIT